MPKPRKDITLSRRVVALPLRTARKAFEREYILANLRKHGGSVTKTASAINYDRTALHRKLKRLVGPKVLTHD